MAYPQLRRGSAREEDTPQTAILAVAISKLRGHGGQAERKASDHPASGNHIRYTNHIE
jgi:hypothetical protein